MKLKIVFLLSLFIYGNAWCTGCWFRSSRSIQEDCLWANSIFELIVCIEKVNGWKL